MRYQRGFTLTELVVVVGLMGVAAAVALPGMRVVIDRNKVITTADLVAAQVREARLAAITRNTAFRVRFNCPDAGAIRMLAVTGNASIDNSADRCSMNQPNDGPAIYMPPGIDFGVDQPPTLEINGRGLISAIGGTMPQTLSVSYGSDSRNLVVTAAGRVNTPAH
jgi:prepilin-type N-terminal cleavage/methylation domain-containing protein